MTRLYSARHIGPMAAEYFPENIGQHANKNARDLAHVPWVGTIPD